MKTMNTNVVNLVMNHVIEMNDYFHLYNMKMEVEEMDLNLS
jgi:hypothetical protein